MGMRPVRTTALAAVAVSSPVVLDYRGQRNGVTVGIQNTGTNTSKVQYTLDDIWAAGWDPATANWVDSDVTSTNTDAAGVLPVQATACRHNMTAFTSGSAYMTVIDSSGPTA